MKKLLVMMLIGSMIFGIAGCSGNDNSSDSKNVSVEATKDDETAEEKTEKETEKETEKDTEEETTTKEEMTTEEEVTEDESPEKDTKPEQETGDKKPVKYDIVPQGSIYYTMDGEELSQGEAMPAVPSIGDVLETPDYIYSYCEFDGENWGIGKIKGWNVKQDITSEYGEILSTIAGEPVAFMFKTFEKSFVKQAPKIPETVKIMYYTFANSMLTDAIDIPDGVVIMEGVFFRCYKLENAPKIANTVKYMDYAFAGCDVLKEVPVIPNNVISMNVTFYGCASLCDVPAIPDTVKYMNYAFGECRALTGEIIFNADPTEYEGCFSNVDLLGQNISFSGDTYLEKEIRSSKKDILPDDFWYEFEY